MDGFDFPIEVVRSARRTRTAQIQLHGSGIQVRVPIDVTDQWVRDLVIYKAPEIKRQIQKKAAIQPVKPKEYVSGESFLYLGRNYRLKVIQGDTNDLKMRGETLVASCKRTAQADQFIQTLLVDWYWHQATIKLQEKVIRTAQTMGVAPVSIKVKDYRSRWGSCSSQGELSFNYRIIMAPHSVIDYVVVHELCHMIEHNHSPRFWNAVRRYMPNYQDQKQWLKDNGRFLII